MAQTEEFINKWKGIAINEAVRTGIPASVTMAQAILESGWGKSGLSVNANNFFGIKADSSWKGPVYNAKTGEVYDGKDVIVDAKFRLYNSAKGSFKDHSEFLMEMPRYNGLWDYNIDDYQNWSYGLKSAGYATSTTYAYKLINLIEKYNLQELDKIAKSRRFWYRIIIVAAVAFLSYAFYNVAKNI